MDAIGVIAQATGDHDFLWAGVITSALALVGIIVTAILARSNGNAVRANANANNKAAESIADRILGELSTGNGHSLGTGVARIEETLWRHETRLDAIDVEVREMSSKVDTAAVLAGQAVKQAEAHLLSHREATE